MRFDLKFALLLTLAGGMLAVTVYAAPFYFDIPKEYAGLVFWAGLSLTVLLLIGATLVGFQGERTAPHRGHVRRMVALSGMIVCGLGFVGFAALYFWPIHRQVSEVTNSAKATIPPTLFSLFMTDLHPQAGLAWFGFIDFELPKSAPKIRVFYNIIDDFNANAKYLSFYIPAIYNKSTAPSTQTISILEYISIHYKEYINDIQEHRWAEAKWLGDSSTVSTKEITFSGRIYIYHADNLSVEQLAALTKAFKENGANPQFRGMDYALAAWDSIQLGRYKAPPRYEVRDNLPRLIPEEDDGHDGSGSASSGP